MVKAQNDMMENLTNLIRGNSIIRKETSVIGPAVEEYVYPPGSEPRADIGKAPVVGSSVEPLYSPGFTPLHVRNFADIVTVGEMIEMTIRNGKLDGGESSRKPPTRRKDNKIMYEKHVVFPYHTSPIQPPYPKWYDVNAQCEYHAGASGHSIKNCLAFKKLVQRLKQINVINFGDNEQPNVAQNPLSNHTGTRVNIVIEEKGNGVITKVSEVKSPIHKIWEQMVKVSWLISNANENKHALPYHCYEDHIIQDCNELKALVQGMMDSKNMEFYHEATKEKGIEICASEGTFKGVYNTNCPLVITPQARIMERVIPKVMITPPSSFPYKDNKQVPWRYGCQLENVESSEAAKEDVDEDDKLAINEPVTENEAIEFLKLLKHNEYSVVEQLHKLLARVSILALLLSFEAHQSALLKVFNQTFVPKNVPVEKIDRLVTNIQADNFLSFSDDEIPSGIMGNPKALHITVRCKGHVLSRVLIDNGSALNVMPLVTLKSYQLTVRT
ncbi:uncharacterized protein LOC120152809 [Hibiscus syriacus]|uniref:uncharacterized protein LOC120152809 n=1 Tax=Hibiscus syriacus TaxID=106335 RepID=UPI001923A773|nr:uncharacterized protein LOC120152809 [Hibiscus syriacus]